MHSGWPSRSLDLAGRVADIKTGRQYAVLGFVGQPGPPGLSSSTSTRTSKRVGLSKPTKKPIPEAGSIVQVGEFKYLPLYPTGAPRVRT